MMEKTLKFLRAAVKSPKSSAAGIAMIAVGIRMLVLNPGTLFTGEPLIAIFGGIGLLLAADAIF